MAEIDKTRIYTVEKGVITEVEQTYDDGHKDLFKLGDLTDIGRILAFKNNTCEYVYAVGDKPANTSQNPDTSWSWVFQLKRIKDHSEKKKVIHSRHSTEGVLCEYCNSGSTSCNDVEAETCENNPGKIK